MLDGRDIGTVICPEAEVKLFVTASAEVRAERRLKELLAAGFETDLATVLADVRQRDARDTERATAPMLAAGDALTLDTSTMGVEQAVAAAIDAVEANHRARIGKSSLTGLRARARVLTLLGGVRADARCRLQATTRATYQEIS